MGTRATAKPAPALVFDTDVLIDYLRGSEGAKRLVDATPHSARVLLAHRMSPSDGLVAATALSTRSRLATGNVRGFRFVSGLQIVPFKA